MDKGFQMVRYYGWYSNRARGERAKREAEPGAPDAADVDVIDVSEYHPPRIPSKKWRELINGENMPPMIAADGGHSDRVFCFAPPPPRRLSSGRKSRQGVHAGNRTAGPTLFVQYPGPWEILASWNASRNGGEKVAAASRPPFGSSS